MVRRSDPRPYSRVYVFHWADLCAERPVSTYITGSQLRRSHVQRRSRYAFDHCTIYERNAPSPGRTTVDLASRQPVTAASGPVAVERFAAGMSVVTVVGDLDSSSYLKFYDGVMSELYLRSCRGMIID